MNTIQAFVVLLLMGTIGMLAQAQSSNEVCDNLQVCAAGVSTASNTMCYQACPPIGCPLIENCGEGIIQGGIIYCAEGE